MILVQSTITEIEKLHFVNVAQIIQCEISRNAL